MVCEKYILQLIFLPGRNGMSDRKTVDLLQGAQVPARLSLRSFFLERINILLCIHNANYYAFAMQTVVHC